MYTSKQQKKELPTNFEKKIQEKPLTLSCFFLFHSYVSFLHEYALLTILQEKGFIL
ncbi:hypothetical protein Bateq7PJ16_2689 [Bacillus subtilis]|nr:hypothetical protein BSSC8_18330 [Bacillus subtilis subsp. subtilis str. SC-8]EME05613.1 hypothetical protein BS732_2942 [Bacillus subtilis MB73/2]KZD84936.1 hypothetical protein B4417_1011 [Bacillus subtilis]NDK00195.1 hypothetical protein [Bacillus subtilis subsp. subtilis]QHF58495.1 hypothetical protein Bateq7PJ16_2689 [Bacillus subtilis]